MQIIRKKPYILEQSSNGPGVKASQANANQIKGRRSKTHDSQAKRAIPAAVY